MWTTVGEITNYGDSVNVQVEDIDNSDWVLELEDIEKDTAKIIQHLNKNERKINGTRHKFQKGQILYSKLRTYLNKVLVAPNDGFCTTEIMAFGSYGILSNNYICYVLRSLYFLDYTLQCGYGVKMPRLSTTDACNGLIPLPPLAEQERIVNEIQRLFSIIDIVENGKDGLQTAIQQAKNKILDHAIHGKLVPQDPNDEPASELLKRINPKAEITCDNPQYGKLLKGWCETTLKSLAKEVFAGGDKPTEFTKEKTNGNIIPIYSNGVEKDGLYGYTNVARVIEPCLTVSARGTIGFT
ncbi:restriction endonuclease subunit S, partial [Segatella copri]